MPISTLEELLAVPTAHDTTAVVEVAGLGTFRVRALSLAERHEMRRECQQGDQWDDDRWEALLLSKCIVEPALTYDQANQLRQRPVFLVNELVAAINGVSGIGARGVVTKAEVDAAEERFRP